MTDIFDFTDETYINDVYTEDGCYLDPDIGYFEQFMRTLGDVLADLPTFDDLA